MSRSRFDPRAWAVAHPGPTVAIFLLASVIMAWGNTLARKGGLLDDPILDETNPYRMSDRYVRDKAAEGFQPREYVPFILRFPGGISSPRHLAKIRQVTEQVKAAFGPAVLSLSEIRDYHDTGESLANDPWIPETIPHDFDVAGWKRRVADDPAVFGTFVGRDFEWAAVLRYLPKGYDETVEYRRTVEFLEGRKIPALEWLGKMEIRQPEGVRVGGGIMLGGWLYQAVDVDNATLTATGIALAFPLFVLALGSVRDALIGLFGVVIVGLLWTRGSIGLLDVLGLPIRERPYAGVVYANCIVQGVSFMLHKFEAFREAAGSDGHASPVADRWRQSAENDRLILATAAIAVSGFVTLGWFQVRSIRELGLLCALSVTWLLALATLFLPALHVLFVRAPARRQHRPLRGAALGFERLLDALVRSATRLVTVFPPRRAAATTCVATVALTVAVALLIWPGGLLHLGTSPLDLVRDTPVEQVGRYLNEPGRLGWDYFDILAEPAAGGDLYDPAFLAAADAYGRDLKRVSGIREVTSIVDPVRRISTESLKKPLPSTRKEARAVFQLIESDLNVAVARQLFYAGGIRITASYESEVTVEIGAVLERALDVGRERHPGLRLSPFNRAAQFAQVDRYVWLGKPLNLFSSQWVVVVACGLAIWLRNRALRATPELSPAIGGLIMSAPFAFATAVMALLMIALGISLDAATAVISALAISASVDFTIYYADAYQRGLARTGSHAAAVRHAMGSKGRLVLQDMLLNTVCFLPLVVSHIRPVQDVGWIMAAMLLACAFGTLVIMPALFHAGLRKEVAAARPLRRSLRR